MDAPGALVEAQKWLMSAEGKNPPTPIVKRLDRLRRAENRNASTLGTYRDELDVGAPLKGLAEPRRAVTASDTKLATTASSAHGARLNASGSVLYTSSTRPAKD